MSIVVRIIIVCCAYFGAILLFGHLFPSLHRFVFGSAGLGLMWLDVVAFVVAFASIRITK